VSDDDDNDRSDVDNNDRSDDDNDRTDVNMSNLDMR